MIGKSKILPTPERQFYYNPETLSGKLERQLLADGLDSIGNEKYREKFKSSNEELRYALLSMPDNERAWRSIWVNKLKLDQLETLHERENQMTRFLISFEVEKWLKVELDCPKLTEKQWEVVIQKNKDFRPMLDRRYKQFSIPPYFIYDNEFDGMEYHHAWDKNAFGKQIQIPIHGRTSDRLRRKEDE